MVLVDTPVWSRALRRRPADLDPTERATEVFRALQTTVADVPWLPISLGDYDRAAEFFNACRSNGITGRHVDMLICASRRHRVALLTTDPDFARYARHVPFKLHHVSR